MTALYQLVEQYRSLERLDASEDLPAEVIRDTLEGLGGELEIKATNVARYILNVEAMAQAVDSAAKAMAMRAKRIQRKAEQMREYLLVNLQGAGIEKIESVEFTLAVRSNPPAVVIDDVEAIPDGLMVTPEPPPTPPPRPDKAAIAKLLKAGTAVPGCHLEQGKRLEIKA